MTYTFWGARGSVPTPLTGEQVKNKISAVVSRIRADDLTSPARREAFLESLPAWLFGTTGGNTTCFGLQQDDGTAIILDAGSGLRELGRRRMAASSGETEYHIFFTHFHYDHLQGLPFFVPCYLPGFTIHFYSPVQDFERIIENQMRHPYFPVTMDGTMRSERRFHTLETEGTMSLGRTRIDWRPVNHPGGSFAYRFEENGKVIIFCPDVALGDTEFARTDANRAFFENADVLVLDAQYTLGEALEKYDWGHSSYSLGVEFASSWNISKLYLFHHEPSYDDRKLYRNLQSARWYADRGGHGGVEIDLAREGVSRTL